MRGDDIRQEGLFSYVSSEVRVRAAAVFYERLVHYDDEIWVISIAC